VSEGGGEDGVSEGGGEDGVSEGGGEDGVSEAGRREQCSAGVHVNPVACSRESRGVFTQNFSAAIYSSTPPSDPHQTV